MNSLLMTGAVVSFLSAFFGYIIVSFWIWPIWTYKRLKKAVSQDMTVFLNSLNNEPEGESVDQEAVSGSAENLRQYSNALMESFSVSLPVWYKFVLRNRGESIEDAVGHLLGLSNTRDYDHARNRIVKVRQTLNM